MTAKLQLISEDGHLKLTCAHCHETKYITEFRKKMKSSTGYTSICKPCNNAKEKISKAKRPAENPAAIASRKYKSSAKYRETFWARHLKRNYNLSVEDYENLLKAQDYSCAICGTKESNRNWKLISNRVNLFVDHNHTTGEVRGMLCNKCNIGIAMLQEDPHILLNALNYLKEHSHGID